MRGGEKGRKSEEFLGLRASKNSDLWVSTNQGQSLNQACQTFGEFKVKSQTLTHKFLIDLEHQVDVGLCMFVAENFGTPIGGERPVVVQPRGSEKSLESKQGKPFPNPRGNPSNPKF